MGAGSHGNRELQGEDGGNGDDLVEECFDAARQLRQLKQELVEERKEVERLKTALQAWEAREQSFVKEIDYLTSRPLLCSVNTDSGQEEEEEEEEVAPVADQQVRCQIQKLQGHVRKRWLDDAMRRIKNGSECLSNADMKAAAIQWVVHAANADVDEWASDDLYAWNFQYRASDPIFLLCCTDALGKKKVYPWYFDFSLLYGC